MKLVVQILDGEVAWSLTKLGHSKRSDIGVFLFSDVLFQTITICVSSFCFSFPRNEELRQIWLENIGRPDLKVNPFAKICSLHFEPDCFSLTLKNNYLKENAFPTIFNLNSNAPIKRVRKKYRVSNKRKKIGKAERNQQFGFSEELKSSQGITYFMILFKLRQLNQTGVIFQLKWWLNQL